MEDMLVLLLATAIDFTLGEPPSTFHPVAWMGKVTSFIERGKPRVSPTAQLVYGVGIVLVTLAVFVVPTFFLLQYLGRMSPVIYVLVGAVLLKSAFSLKGLRQAALGIKTLLQRDRLEDARFELRALVKRDTRELPEPLLVSATVESVAENASDSFVAPLFYFLLLGVPGAIGYRVVNTLDAMIGYHGEYEYLGKFAARLDDLLNLIPARLTALLIVLAAFLNRKDWRGAWRVALSDHSRTVSPNAGWPMAAMAGALDIGLEKVRHYRLGRTDKLPALPAIDDSLKLVLSASLIWVAICLATGGIRFALAT